MQVKGNKQPAQPAVEPKTNGRGQTKFLASPYEFWQIRRYFLGMLLLYYIGLDAPIVG